MRKFSLFLALLVLFSCSTKKKITETVSEQGLLQTSAASFCQTSFVDSLMSHMTLSIDKITFCSDGWLSTTPPDDSISHPDAKASPNKRRIIAEGVRLENVLTSQKTSSATHSAQTDSTSCQTINSKTKVSETTRKHSFCIAFYIFLAVVIAIGAYLCYRKIHFPPWLAKRS